MYIYIYIYVYIYIYIYTYIYIYVNPRTTVRSAIMNCAPHALSPSGALGLTRSVFEYRWGGGLSIPCLNSRRMWVPDVCLPKQL